MRLHALRRPLLVAIVPAALVLAACSSGSSNGSPSSGASTSTSAAPSSIASGSLGTSNSASPLPSVSPTFDVGDGPTPTVAGDFGTKPTLTLPTATPSGNLVIKTLKQGSGAVVQKGDLLVADYLGEVWNTAATVFDNSYDHKAPAAFPIGVGQVIPGWDKALVGLKVGTRVVLVIPPAAGYGAGGQSAAGISGTDTLVFVVDIINRYDGSGRANGTKTSESLKGLPTVTGALDAKPTVNVPAGTAPPTKAQVVILYKGTGAPVKTPSLLIAQYVAVGWDNTALADTWTVALPNGLGVGETSTASPAVASPFDSLVGIPVGSRVLLLIPATDSTKAQTQSIAAVIDIIGDEQSGVAK